MMIRLNDKVALNYDLRVGSILLREKDSVGVVVRIDDGWDVRFSNPDETLYVRGLGNPLRKEESEESNHESSNTIF